MMCGALTGLGLIVPGLSPSNFLMYMGLYQPMAAGVKTLNFGVIIPMLLGLVAVIFALAKLISWLFKKHYALLYHIILGVVFGSTLAIVPIVSETKGVMIGADAFPWINSRNWLLSTSQNQLSSACFWHWLVSRHRFCLPNLTRSTHTSRFFRLF